MAAQTVEALLARAEQEDADKLRRVTVQKELELQIDLGNLLACDPNPPDAQGRRAVAGSELEERLRALARDNTQLLVNALWALPAERLAGGEAVLVAKLPEPSVRLPREKPPPKPRAPTRWEQFAKLKGIQKRKKTNLVWDEARGEWRRRWGYQRAGDDTKDWLIEVPEVADPERDLFGERRQAKRERVAKNELNRLRNIARAQRSGGGRVPGPGGLAPAPGGSHSKQQLGRAMRVARSSTASAGRFQERLPREKEEPRGGGKKRSFQPLIGDLGAERKRQLELLGLMHNKKPKLDVTRAAHKQMREEDSDAASLRRRQPKKAGRASKGPGGKTRGKKVGKGVVGKRKTTGGKGKIPGGKGRSPGGKSPGGKRNRK
ncbi:ribosome biogenesis regulatory protein homolog [Ambystoma mexicanum]|uniref:ribosome biogenesis regulatory protein homolog n=1 Tax=Ambystoma mexicanum TaxID=8296 RepID=UPI0037E91ADC